MKKNRVARLASGRPGKDRCRLDLDLTLRDLQQIN
jgi:hypothetical protein